MNKDAAIITLAMSFADAMKAFPDRLVPGEMGGDFFADIARGVHFRIRDGVPVAGLDNSTSRLMQAMWAAIQDFPGEHRDDRGDYAGRAAHAAYEYLQRIRGVR